MAKGEKGLVFQRVEKKYLLDPMQYKQLMEAIKPHMQADQYGLSTICNIYFDTEDNKLIRSSIEKPPYKEKMRLRSYGIPDAKDTVYLELKKKCNSIVYKRRIPLTLKEARDYLLAGVLPCLSSQILREIDYFIHFYNPIPKLYLAYDRTAYFGKEDAEFRMTFDSGIRSRREDLFLEHGDYGIPLYKEDYSLLEIKASGAYPLWLARALSESKVFPVSFSKYGTIYQKETMEKMTEKTAGTAETIEEGDNLLCLPV